MSVNDFLSLFENTLTGILELPVFTWFISSVVFASTIGCVLWLVLGKR